MPDNLADRSGPAFRRADASAVTRPEVWATEPRIHAAELGQASHDDPAGFPYTRRHQSRSLARTGRVSHLATLGCGAGSANLDRPTRSCSRYRRSWRPAVAEIVGNGRRWTVLMISELSIPCR